MSHPSPAEAELSPTVEANGHGNPTGLQRVLRRVSRQPLTLISLAWLLFVVLCAVAAPWIAPHDPLENNFTREEVLAGPSAEHWLGTDENGRDVLSRLLFGARVALVVGFGSVTLAMVAGVSIGLLLGYRGGWWDRLGTRFVDIVDSVPPLLVAFAVVAMLGRGLPSILLAVGLMSCMSFARTARAITLAERSKLYVDAAKVAGIRDTAILFRQVLPNLAGPLVIQGAILTGTAIIIESVLSFLGIGLDSTIPSWGGLLGVAAFKQAQQPFLAFPPGITIMLTVLAFNLVSDGISEALHGEKRKRFRRRRSPVVAAEPALVAEPRTASRGGVVTATSLTAPANPGSILEIRGLNVELQTASASVPLVRDVWLSIRKGEIVGLLGESGSGKSMLARSVLGLLQPGIGIASGAVLLDGRDIASRSERELRGVRGRQLAAVFQDPMAALSPVHTIGQHLSEPLRVHFGMTKKQARVRAAELLDRVGVANAAGRLDDYPHQFSGGMAQRVAIAMALASEPRLLIADEATSALDVTTQAQVLDLLLDLRDEFGLAMLLITHDLGVVAEACDRAAVMYAGEIVETSDMRGLFDHPRHPYTAALLAANPTSDAPRASRLSTIPGNVPLAGHWPVGCHFAGRCSYAREQCTVAPVPMVDSVRCVRAPELVLDRAGA